MQKGNLKSQCIIIALPPFLCVSGDRAEGAEAALQVGLNKLTLTVAPTEDEDSGNEQGPRYAHPEIAPPSSATPILLVNSV